MIKMPKVPSQISSLKKRIAKLQSALRAAESKYRVRCDKVKKKNAAAQKKISLRSELKRLTKRAA